MKKIIIVVLLLVICLFSKCTRSSNRSETTTKGTVIENNNILTFKFDFGKDPVDIQETGLIYDVEIFSLDCEEALFNEINKIIRYKNRIYLLDISQTYSVVIYDTLGNFVNLIEKQGQGPQEYVQLVDIFINPDDETLNLVSRDDRKILKHDLDGNIIEVEKMPRMFKGLLKMKDEYIGYVGNDRDEDKPYNIWTLSDKFKLKEGFFEINSTWNSKTLGGGSVFSQYGDKTYYITPLDFNIYSIQNGVFSIAYNYDFGKWAWPEDHREFGKYEELLNNGGRERYIHRLYRFQETQNYTISEVLYQGQSRLCIYNKQINKTYVAKLNINNHY
jgi:hypothetical protein